jgi:hypothetical protein
MGRSRNRNSNKKSRELCPICCGSFVNLVLHLNSSNGCTAAGNHPPAANTSDDSCSTKNYLPDAPHPDSNMAEQGAGTLTSSPEFSIVSSHHDAPSTSIAFLSQTARAGATHALINLKHQEEDYGSIGNGHADNSVIIDNKEEDDSLVEASSCDSSGENNSPHHPRMIHQTINPLLQESGSLFRA